MMKNSEEHKLDEWKTKYQSIDVTDEELNQAIQIGFNKAKREHIFTIRKFNIALTTVSAAAILFILFIAAINMSSDFNKAVSNIPGMDYVVGFFEGEESNKQKDFYEDIGITSQEGPFELTINGVLRDRFGIIIDYTIKADSRQDQFEITNFQLTNEDGENVSTGSVSYGSPAEENSKTYRDTIEIINHGHEPIDTTNFNLELSVKGTDQEETFNINFEATHMPSPKIYNLNEVVTIEGQTFTIRRVESHPLRTLVEILPDPNNDMKILKFEDLRVIDENGNEWEGIKNGLTISGPFDDGTLLYHLEGNYYSNSDNLYLSLSKLQAVSKEEAQVKFDVENDRIIDNPIDLFHDLSSFNSGFELKMKNVADYRGVPFSTFYNEDGEEIEQKTVSYSPGDEESTIFVTFNEQINGVISAELISYPNWIEEEKVIIIK